MQKFSSHSLGQIHNQAVVQLSAHNMHTTKRSQNKVLSIQYIFTTRNVYHSVFEHNFPKPKRQGCGALMKIGQSVGRSSI